ncbi:MAG: AraC family transcriptional regulator [Myxococcales bacterium]|jgi:AraC-like DNA-binding protein
MVSCSLQRQKLSDMWSATLVINPSEGVCGSAWLRGEQRPFRSGDILLANAGDVQRILPADRPSSFFTIFWERTALERAAAEACTTGAPHWSLALLAAGPVSAELGHLRDLLENGASAATVETAYRSATTALLRVATATRDVTRTVCHPGVRRAAVRAAASLSEPLSLEQMAREVRMSKCHLVRCFQNALGVPPHRYRTLLRLQRARRLLETGLSVAEVAEETGFADAPHLTRSFREWLGVSPAAWGNAWRASDPWTEKRPRTMPPPVLNSTARR